MVYVPPAKTPGSAWETNNMVSGKIGTRWYRLFLSPLRYFPPPATLFNNWVNRKSEGGIVQFNNLATERTPAKY